MTDAYLLGLPRAKCWRSSRWIRQPSTWQEMNIGNTFRYWRRNEHGSQRPCGRFESDATSSLATSNLRSARVRRFATVAIFLGKLQAASPVRRCQAGPSCIAQRSFFANSFGPRVPCIYSGAWNNYKV